MAINSQCTTEMQTIAEREGGEELMRGGRPTGIASPASEQHVGHERHRVHTPNNVHHIDHHSGESGGQCFRDDGARGTYQSTKVMIPRNVMKFIVIPLSGQDWVFSTYDTL